jgi:hypothetical protein
VKRSSREKRPATPRRSGPRAWAPEWHAAQPALVNTNCPRSASPADQSNFARRVLQPVRSTPSGPPRRAANSG